MAEKKNSPSSKPAARNTAGGKAANQESGKDELPILSRRNFLKASGVAAAGAIGLAAAGCGAPEPEHTLPNATVSKIPIAQQYPAVPYTPTEPPPTGVLQFFTPQEAQMVEALTARILPGTPEDPGAREAGVVYYIDNLLAYQEGMPEPVYRQTPYAEPYQGDTPPTENGAFQVIWVPEDEMERYGYQSILTPRDVFRLGMAAVERYARTKFGQSLLALSEEEQDQIIADLLNNEATGFEPLSPESFFHTLRRYTGEGMFSDPVYGGNRNLVGWRLIGYPGAQRAYTPQEVIIEGSGLAREVWGITDMPHFHPGEPVGPNAVLPVSGSKENREE
jgi:gluconate 2-dehydrogenase gamma chain